MRPSARVGGSEEARFRQQRFLAMILFQMAITPLAGDSTQTVLAWVLFQNLIF